MSETKSTLAQIRQERLLKIKGLREIGINPYPSNAQKDVSNIEVVSNYNQYEGGHVCLTGRIMSWREHGHIIFGHIQDQTGKIQLYIKSETLSPTSKDKQTLGFQDLKLLDIGDFVQACGTVTKTKRGEISLLVEELKLLTKAVRPLPEKWQGLKQKEERFRRRYLDMTMNPDTRKIFERRARFWEAIRSFLYKKGFIEIYIPVLEHVTGGADATPFVTHMNALNTDYYLRISQELPLKRLIGGGFEKVFEIGPRFRNEGISDEHLPEHIAMEYYWAYADYKKAMKLNTEMYRHIAEQVYGTQKFIINGMKVNLADEWREIDFIKIMREAFGIDIFNSTVRELKKIAGQKKIELGNDNNRNRLLDTLWKELRKTITGPAYLINEPKFLSPLAKSKPSDERITERYHILIAGSELGNGYSELNDPIDQYQRFLEQQKLREEGDEEAQMMDIDFIEMLEYGMPPTTGFGLSERVFWYFEGLSAREATPFPHMKADMEETTKEIYPEFVKLQTKEQFELIESTLAGLGENSIVTMNQEVKKDFQGLKFGYLVVDRLKIGQSNAMIQNFKKEIEQLVQKRYQDKAAIKKSLNLEGFRVIYGELGVDPRSRLNSAEALIRRVVDDKGFYDVNNLVDVYNTISAYLELPIAAYDIQKIKGMIELRYARTGDEIIKIGETKPTQIKVGELVYADEAGPICLDLNYRDADRTKITESTTKALILVDGHQEITSKEIQKSLRNLRGYIEKFNIGKVIGYGLSE